MGIERKESLDWALSLVRFFQAANDCDYNFLSKHPIIVQAFTKTWLREDKHIQKFKNWNDFNCIEFHDIQTINHKKNIIHETYKLHNC